MAYPTALVNVPIKTIIVSTRQYIRKKKFVPRWCNTVQRKVLQGFSFHR